MGSRPSKFFDAGEKVDSKRIELLFHFPNVASPNNVEGKQWVIDHMQDSDAWMMSTKAPQWPRSEEHTSELQSLMRISYAVFCLKKNKQTREIYNSIINTDKPRMKRRHEHNQIT